METATVTFTPTTRNRRKIPVGKQEQVSFQAKQFTGRTWDLRNSIRRVNKFDRPGNVRVYAGNKAVNYAHFVEYGTVKNGSKTIYETGLFNKLKIMSFQESKTEFLKIRRWKDERGDYFL